MPPKKHGVVWKADPHTIAKIEILKKYLGAWFQIFGRSKGRQALLYVDGFAGPGEYSNYPDGSPTAALMAAKSALSLAGTDWIAGDIHCAFVEANPGRCENLLERIKPFEGTPGLCIHTYQMPFVEGLAQLKSELPLPFKQSHPLFVFIDPFGPTGVPFHVVADILKSRCSEVLINLDADGISRILQAGKSADHETNLNQVFGDDSWKTILDPNQVFDVLCRQVLSLYQSKLRGLPRVRYVFSFEMRAATGTLNYFLVFASQHPLGLVKMKEAMKKMDQAGDYRFSDASVGQPTLFRFDDPSMYSTILFNHFKGRKTSYAELQDYALNETPFVNPKAMLKHLENAGLIQVQSSDPKRKRGTFNEDKIIAITFAEDSQSG